MDVDLRQALLLVKNGVPLDLAFALDPEEVLAWCIIFGEFEGGRWSWEDMSWQEPG